MSHTPRTWALAALVTLFATAGAPAQPAQVKEPARPEKVDVQIRYRIRADRDERIRQYRVLEKHLAGLGFDNARKNDPDFDLDILDPNGERFSGSVPGAKVLDILNDPRVQNVLFAPAGFAYPDAPDKPVAVKIGLRTGLSRGSQQALHRQTIAHLAKLGYVDALGYETKGYTLLRGYVPLKALDLLMKDVRAEPGGWFLADTPTDALPVPLRDRNPLRWVEVVPIAEFPVPFAAPPVLPAQLRYSSDLRAKLLEADTKDKPLRVELVFGAPVDAEGLRGRLGRYAGASLDGVVGNVANVRFPRGSYVEQVALEPGVLCVRLPRNAHETAMRVAGKGTAPADAVTAARLDALHKLGYTGSGSKVVLIGSDFTGYEKLPKRATLLDLTTELLPDLQPAPSDPLRAGTGTAAARALLAAAPDVELVLVRIDPGCFFHLPAVLKLTRGELEFTDALRERLGEIADRSSALDRARRDAISAYKAAFADLSDNQVAIELRKRAKADLDAVLKTEDDLAELVKRFNDYKKVLVEAPKGARVVVNTLEWETGYPLDALNDFASTIEKLSANPPVALTRPNSKPRTPLVWVQAASNAGASVWSGPFRDHSGDGLLDFAPHGTVLPEGAWSPKLNFLGVRGSDGGAVETLAKGAKLRLTVQWREPADPNFPESDVPAYPLVLRVLRQMDPAGEKRSSDEMEETSRSASVPTVIYRTNSFLVFEQAQEFTVPVDGRYAVALESAAVAEPLIPALKRNVEINPRIVIETPGAPASAPQTVFRTFATTGAGVGTPGDAAGAITVGAPFTGAQAGGGPGLALRAKPNVFGPTALDFGGETFAGPGTATGFAGGAAVVLLQAHASGPNVFRAAGIADGKPLVVPESWLKFVSPAKR
jgi:hypothetical protein